MDESQNTEGKKEIQKSKYCMITFIKNSKSKLIYGEEV
jgi:hypothetical protein